MKKPIFLTLLLILVSNLACLSARASATFDRLNVTSTPYNAIPNDNTPDTTQIMAAINQVMPSPTPGYTPTKSIYFPAGTYIFAGQMTLPANTSFRLYGDGPGVTTIIFTGSDAGINATSMGTNTLDVEGLTLMASTPNCGTAIHASFGEVGPGTKFHTATIHNVEILGSLRDADGGGYWTKGIWLYKAQNSVLDKIEIHGNHTAARGGPPTQFGIVWESSTDYATTGLEASNLQIIYVNTALQTNGWVEGVFVQGFEFTFSGQADMPVIDLNSIDAANPANPKPGFQLVNGHIHTWQHGIRLTNLRAVKLSKIYILHQPTPQFGFSGNDVAFNNCSDGVVSQCTFIGVESNIPDETGIRLNNAHFMRLEGNYFTRMFPANVNASCIAIESRPALQSASSTTCSNSPGRVGAASETAIATRRPIPIIGTIIDN